MTSEVNAVSRKGKISALILLLAIVKNSLYSLLENLMAIYLGIAHSEGAFAGVCSVVFLFNCVMFLMLKPKLVPRIWAIIIASCCWGFLGLLQGLARGLSNAHFFFFVFCFDTILWTCVVYKENCFSTFSYYFGVFIFWFGLASTLITFGSLLLTGQVRSVGVNSYQGASYNSAFCFGMIWFYYLKSDWFKQKYKYAWCLLPLLFVATVLPGGRGAFVLLVAYTIWCMGIILRRTRCARLKKTIKPMTLVIGVAILVVVLYFLFTNINRYIDVLRGGFQRAVSFLDFESGSLNFATGSSGRGTIYEYALEKIGERPLTGYGIYGYLYIGLSPYPHNIILEILLQYGVVLGIPLLAILLVFELRLIKKGEFLQLGISFYVYVNLMFSGSYTFNAFFWFLFVFAIAEMLGHKPERDKVVIAHDGNIHMTDGRAFPLKHEV